MPIELQPGDPGQFELKDVNPLHGTGMFGADLEEGMLDPNRQSLTDTFGQEGLAAGMTQLTQMVTPQSMWQNPSASSLMSDFVEFSPLGDVRDFLSAVNPNSGMDWLERGLGIASVIPGVGSVTAASAWKINQQLYMRRMERLQKGAADLLKNPSLLPETVSAAMYYDLREGVEYDPEQPIGDMTAEQYAAKKQQMELNATLREGIEEGERILVADDVYELADIMLKGNIGGSSHLADVDTVAAYLRELGQVVRQALPEVFDADPSLSESQKTLKAAQVSLYTYKQVADAGILYFADMQKTTEQGADAAVTHPTNLMRGYHGSDFAINLINRGARLAAFELHRIAGVTRALAHANIGPNLAATPQVRLGAVIVPKEGSTHGTGEQSYSAPSGQEARVVLFGNELLPDVRLMDEHGILLDTRAFQDRQRKVEYQSLTGDMAGNILHFLQKADEQPRARLERSRYWYRRANASARSISATTGLPVRQVAALLAVLSPRSRWAPDNLVAAIHGAFRFAKQDMHPDSPEYRQAFRDAIMVGGWEYDLLEESSDKLRRQYQGDMSGLIDYYADINNFMTSKKTSMRGMSLLDHRIGAALASIVQADPAVILGMAKTSNFYGAIVNPADPDFMAIDVWQDAMAMGFKSKLEPAGSLHARKLPKGKQGDAGVELGSKEVLDNETIERNKDLLRQQGFSEAEIAKFEKRFRGIPVEADEARYAEIVRAVNIARDVHDPQMVPNQAQSVSWIAGRDTWYKKQQALTGMKRELKQLKEAGRYKAAAEKRAEIEALSPTLVLDRSIVHHVEGNPQFQKSLVALTQNVSSDLSVGIPIEFLESQSPKAAKLDEAGTPVVVMSRPDGTSEVWADTTNGPLMRTLRHLEPTAMKVGGWTRMVPKRRTRTPSVQSSLETYRDASPGGEVRVVPMQTYVGDQPGNYFVFEFEDDTKLAPALQALEATESGPYESTTQQVAVDPSGGSGSVGDVKNIDRRVLNDPSKSPLVTNDWVAIDAGQNTEQSGLSEGGLMSYNQRATVEMEEDLIRLVMKHHRVTRAEAEASVELIDGFYEGEQMPQSFLVFGVPYSAVMEIARKYNQESIATRNGIVYTTGENAGKLHPLTGQVYFGRAATQQDGHSVIHHPEGDVAFSMGYDWMSTEDLPGPPDSLMGGHVEQTPRKQLIVALDGAEGHAQWFETDKIWNELSAMATSSTAYTNGDLHRPPGTAPIEEHVLDDGVSLGVWRTRVGSGNPSAVRAYVPTHENTYHSATGLEKPTFLTKKDASMELRTKLPDGPNPTIAGVEIAVDSSMEPGHTKRGILEWTWSDGETEYDIDGFLIDLNGHVPRISPSIGATQQMLSAPGVVTGYIQNGRAVLEGSDPTVHTEAAEVLRRIGYKVDDIANLWYEPDAPKPDNSVRYASDIEFTMSGIRTKATPTPNDLAATAYLSSTHNAPIEITSSGSISEASLNNLVRLIDGLMTPNRSPDWIKPLHDKGLTLAPHVLGEGTPKGIHVVATGMPQSTHAVTDKGANPGDVQLVMNAKQIQIEEQFGPEWIIALDRLRAPNHFSNQGAAPRLSDRTFLHEVGHVVEAYFEHASLQWQGKTSMVDGVSVHRFGGPTFYRMELDVLMDELGFFGQSENVSGYAVGDPAEFFAESFVKVATGQADPRIERLVRAVVELVNQTPPTVTDGITEAQFREALDGSA